MWRNLPYITPNERQLAKPIVNNGTLFRLPRTGDIMGDWNEEEEESGWKQPEEDEGGVLKPRKAKANSIKYLQSVDANWEETAEASRAQAHNVARELRWEAASIAADRAGGELLEKVARKCSKVFVERIARWSVLPKKLKRVKGARRTPISLRRTGTRRTCCRLCLRCWSRSRKR